MMAVVQLRNPTPGRAYHDRKVAAGKTPNEAMRCLKRRLSGLACKTMLDDLVVSAGTGPGGHRGNVSDSSAAGSHPHTSSSDKSPALGSPSARMDLLRVSISFVMILGLFAIVAAVAFHPKSSNISPYISLMSGLAGIALGWLFGSGATPVTGASVSRRQRRGANAQSAQQ